MTAFEAVFKESGENVMHDSNLIRRIWLTLVTSFGLVPMTALAASDSGTITVGSQSVPPNLCFWGYLGSVGSYSPTGLTGGRTVADLYTSVVGPSCEGSLSGHLFVSGFSSYPDQSWLTSVDCNGTTKTGSTANYDYYSSSGMAEWSWVSTSWGFPSNVDSQLACTIVHS